MTLSSTNDIPAETLRKIIQQYGTSICDDPRRCEALLKDLCGEYKREIHLLMGAHYEKIPSELQRGLPLDLQRPRLAQQLVDDRGFDDVWAEWAVNAWAYGLGLVQQPPSRVVAASQVRPTQARPTQPSTVQAYTPPSYTPPPPPARVARPVSAPVIQPDPTGDDFDIIDNGNQGGGRSRSWFWVVLVFSIIFLAFASGMAIMTMMNRSAPEASAPVVLPFGTPTPSGPTPAAVAQSTPTLQTRVAATATVSTPTVAATATLTPTATPQLACTQAVAQELASLYDRATLGCAVAGPNIVWAAWESFERGAMLWRSDTDLAYTFFSDGQWSPINEHWDGKDIPSRGTPPQGLQAPVRGFGYVWGIRDDFFNRLGWAREQEKGFCATIQPFEKGFILQSSTIEFCTPDNLYNHSRDGDWAPLFFAMMEGGQWRNAGSASAPPPAAPPPAPAAQNPQTRPAANGLFYASQANGINLDATFDDWPDHWLPIAALIQGAENYKNPQDISGDFQAAWSPAGLFLAVRVNDDKYRNGPDGTDMWKGDALEIHFDRQLAADYDQTTADADDYQVGVSFGPKLRELRGYRWLPREKEGSFRMEGAVREDKQGYQVEILLPWALFEQDGNLVQVGQTFGFNISISDNDDKEAAQQTVLSASPARTTFDNPTQWGTLIIQG
ncbi:MAG: hypothetical protein NT075_22535 [Chloroflexi bacterium]|nr:hypothetical protein [Chloroflexota bacterium]